MTPKSMQWSCTSLIKIGRFRLSLFESWFPEFLIDIWIKEPGQEKPKGWDTNYCGRNSFLVRHACFCKNVQHVVWNSAHFTLWVKIFEGKKIIIASSLHHVHCSADCLWSNNQNVPLAVTVFFGSRKSRWWYVTRYLLESALGDFSHLCLSSHPPAYCTCPLN